MQPNEYQHIEALLERFFDGDTSNQEEQELYAFFARRDLPEHLLPYKEVLGYFEKGIAREVAAVETPAPVRKDPFVRRWLWAGIAIAASLSLFLFLNNRGSKEEESFNPYTGSYIIRNGVRTEIPEEVAREIDKVVRETEKEKYEKERMAIRTFRQHQENMERLDKKKKQIECMENTINKIEEEFINQ